MSADTVIERLCHGLGVEVPAEVRRALALFGEVVQQWNRRTNLIADGSAEAVAELLFADALVLVDPRLVPLGARVVDVGAGAGAPAIPLALLRDDVSVCLVEPRRKRMAFLRTAAGRLVASPAVGAQLMARLFFVEAKLDGPATGREPAPKWPGSPFDVAMSRATFAPGDWLVQGLGLAPRVLVMTTGAMSSSQDAGPADPPAAAGDGGIRRVAERAYRLPFSGRERLITAWRRD